MTAGCMTGAPCWVSLMARSLDGAADFYGPLLGWRFVTGPEPWGRYLRAFAGDREVAGVGEVARDWEYPVTWTTYFGTENANDTAASISERGGTVAVGPLEFEAGRIALVADPAGAAFGIWEATGSAGSGLRSGVASVWTELRTRDAFDAAIFYGNVFDWDGRDPARYEVRWEYDHVVLHVDGRSVAALHGGGTEGAVDPRVRPRWHVFFPVPDVDEAVREAEKLGGELMDEPRDSLHGRTAGLRDPDGALFSVISASG